MNRETAIQTGKREIIDDARAGVIPWTVRAFCELHEHTDANMYATLSDGRMTTRQKNEIIDTLDAWLKAGALTTHKDTP